MGRKKVIDSKKTEDVMIEEVKEPKTQEEVVEVAKEITPHVMDSDKIMDTIRVFGKCRVVVDEIVVYNRSNFSRTSTESILKRDKTFYFDRMHITNKNNMYVSWNGMNGKRNYTLFKDLNTGQSPVIKIAL